MHHEDAVQLLFESASRLLQ